MNYTLKLEDIKNMMETAKQVEAAGLVVSHFVIDCEKDTISMNFAPLIIGMTEDKE